MRKTRERVVVGDVVGTTDNFMVEGVLSEKGERYVGWVLYVWPSHRPIYCIVGIWVTRNV